MDLYLATTNSHKVDELRVILERADLPVRVLPAAEIGGMPAVEENAATFEGNAGLKARALRQIAPPYAGVIADDSGLEVDILGGRPGVHSARYAGPHADAAAHNTKLLEALEGLKGPARRAQFVCVLVYIGPESEREYVFRGECDGSIALQPRGEHGFGYDPIFIASKYGKTFAELGPTIKSLDSHRALALQKFAAFLREQEAAGLIPF